MEESQNIKIKKLITKDNIEDIIDKFSNGEHLIHIITFDERYKLPLFLKLNIDSEDKIIPTWSSWIGFQTQSGRRFSYKENLSYEEVFYKGILKFLKSKRNKYQELYLVLLDENKRKLYVCKNCITDKTKIQTRNKKAIYCDDCGDYGVALYLAHEIKEPIMYRTE
jgi:hypothetical protein